MRKRPMRWRTAVVVAALPLALAACTSGTGATPGSSATPDPSTGDSASPAATQPASPVPGLSSVPGRSEPAGPGGGSGATTPGRPVWAGVNITRTGGFAGVMQALAIAGDGSWTFTDKRDGSTQQGKLTTAQRGDLARLAADPGLPAESRAKAPAACADGYIYLIAIGELSVRYDQCGGAGGRPLTDQLLAVVVDATPM